MMGAVLHPLRKAGGARRLRPPPKEPPPKEPSAKQITPGRHGCRVVPGSGPVGEPFECNVIPGKKQDCAPRQSSGDNDIEWQTDVDTHQLSTDQ